LKKEHLEAIANDPKEFLSRGRNIKALITAKQEHIDEWRKLSESTTVTLKSGGGSKIGYKQGLMENAVCNIIDLENEIFIEINELVELERDIREAINTLLTDTRHKAIFELRYIQHLKLEEIAVKLNYAFRWVQRLNGRALAAMKKAALICIENAV